jgi:hypothetical protein
VRGDCPRDRYGREPYTWLRDCAKDALREQFGYELNQEETEVLQTAKAASKAKAAAHEEAVYKRLGFRPGDRVMVIAGGHFHGITGTLNGY